MNTREIAAEYRLAHWAQIMRERRESGLSIKTFCENAGFHENVYYYWQRKLRESACERLNEHQAKQTGLTVSGFAEVKLREAPMLQAGNPASQIYVETGQYKIIAGGSYPTQALAALLRELTRPC